MLAWWMWDWRDGIRLGIWYEIAGVWACESGDDGSARRGTGTVLDGGMSGGVGCGWGGWCGGIDKFAGCVGVAGVEIGDQMRWDSTTDDGGIYLRSSSWCVLD